MFSNLGDHLPISFDFELVQNPNFSETKRKMQPKLPRLDHEDPIQIIKYAELVDDEIEKTYQTVVETIIAAQTSIEVENAASEVLKRIKRTLLNTTEAVVIEKKSNYGHGLSKRKRKPWWDADLSDMHRKLCLAYTQFRDSHFKPEYRQPHEKAKSDFKKYRKLKEAEHKDAKLKQINLLFKTNINGFWRRMKTMSRIKQLISAPLKDIRTAYEEIFNKRTKSKIDEKQVEEKLNEYLEKAENEDNSNYSIPKKAFEDVVKSLSNGKSRGISLISNEMVKYCKSSLLRELLRITYEKMIRYAAMPKDFTTAIIKPLVKDAAQPSDSINNLRPIAISDVFAIIYEKIILIEIRKTRTEHKKQFGFKSNSSCAHAIFLVLQALKQSLKLNRPIYMLAIDLTKAFDKVYRPLLWLKMFEAGCHGIVIISLMKYYSLSCAYIEIDGERSQIIHLTSGVLQGGPGSPTLFNYTGDGFIECIEKLEFGVSIGLERIDTILYADDDFVISQREAQMHKQIEALTEYADANGLEINVKKTKYLSTATTITKEPVMYGAAIERVSQFKYLGLEITIDGKHNAHVARRRNLAYAASAMLTTNGFTSYAVHAKVKARLLTTFVRSILTYGLENCEMNASLLGKIKSTESNILKKFLSLPRCLKSTPLYASLRITPIEAYLKMQKIKFFKRLRANEYTNNVLNQLSKNSFKGCFFDELTNAMGYRTQISYSISQVTGIADQQINELEKANKIRKIEPQSETSKKISNFFEIVSPIERRIALTQELWPHNTA